jgi:hypothetical protein
MDESIYYRLRIQELSKVVCSSTADSTRIELLELLTKYEGLTSSEAYTHIRALIRSNNRSKRDRYAKVK